MPYGFLSGCALRVKSLLEVYTSTTCLKVRSPDCSWKQLQEFLNLEGLSQCHTRGRAFSAAKTSVPFKRGFKYLRRNPSPSMRSKRWLFWSCCCLWSGVCVGCFLVLNSCFLFSVSERMDAWVVSLLVYINSLLPDFLEDYCFRTGTSGIDLLASLGHFSCTVSLPLSDLGPKMLLMLRLGVLASKAPFPQFIVLPLHKRTFKPYCVVETRSLPPPVPARRCGAVRNTELGKVSLPNLPRDTSVFNKAKSSSFSQA